MNDPTCPFCGGNDRDAPCEIERRYLEMIQPYVRLKADIHAKSAAMAIVRLKADIHAKSAAMAIVRLKADIHAKSAAMAMFPDGHVEYLLTGDAKAAVEKIDGILEVIAREMTRKARLKPLTPDQYEENLLQHGIAR